MPEPYYRLLHLVEDDADAMREVLLRVRAERPGESSDARLLTDLADAIKNGVRYGGQHPKAAE